MLLLPADLTAKQATPLARTGELAAVIAAPGKGDARDCERLADLARLFQDAEAAFLVNGREDLARKLDIDGAHISGVGALKKSLSALKPARIAGAGGLATRHDAMEAGEMGADYVLFGDLDGPFEATLDAVEWWAELFEVPCVGIATSLEEAEALAEAGAEFVALSGPALTGEMIAAVSARLAEATP